MKTGKTLLLIADLITRQQVKSAFLDNCFIRNIDELVEVLEDGTSSRIVVDLANVKIDILKALEVIKSAQLEEQTICFYPHVQVDLAQAAVQLGFKDIQVRSKFFNNLQSASL